MSDITITTANLSKFSRRLQKALAEEFNQDIKLSTANTLFAKSVGKKNFYELQKAILVQTSDTKKILSENSVHGLNLNKKDYRRSAQDFYDDIPADTNYTRKVSLFLHNIKEYVEKAITTGIHYISMEQNDEGEPYILFCAKLKNKDCVVNGMFCLPFTYPLDYAKSVFDDYDLTDKDVEFLKDLCDNWFPNTWIEGQAFGTLLKKEFGFNRNKTNHLIVSRETVEERIYFQGSGSFSLKYIVIDKQLFENGDYSRKEDGDFFSKWTNVSSLVESYPNKIEVFDTFDGAFQEMKGKNLVLMDCFQEMFMDEDQRKNLRGSHLSSFWIERDKHKLNEFIFNSAKGGLSLHFEKDKGLPFYTGWIANSLMHSSISTNPYYKNTALHRSWNCGFKEAMRPLFAQNKNLNKEFRKDNLMFPMVVRAKCEDDLNQKLDSFRNLSGQYLERQKDDVSLVYDVLSITSDCLFAIVYKRGPTINTVTTEDKMYAVVKQVYSGTIKKSNKTIMREVLYIWPDVNQEKIKHTIDLVKIYNKTEASQRAKTKKIRFSTSG